MEALDTKISQLQNIAKKLGDSSLNTKIAAVQRQKEIMALRETVSNQQAANQDKKEELILVLGEENRDTISKLDEKSLLEIDKFNQKGLTADEIKLIMF